MKAKGLKLESVQAEGMSDDDAEVVVGLVARWILGQLDKPKEKGKEPENPRGSRVKELP